MLATSRNWPTAVRALHGLLAMSSAPDPRLTDTVPADLSTPPGGGSVGP